jgi:predicted RNA-binding protein associated with RNAse of E/G family
VVDPAETVSVEVVYTRLPDHVKRFRQELLHDGPDCRITLLNITPDRAPLKIGDVQLAEGGAVLWFLFPGRAWEVAAAYDPAGQLVGYYTNFVRPPQLQPGRWHITDLYLDIWQPADGAPRLLDADDLARAVEQGVVTADEAHRVRDEAAGVLRAAGAGRWPPRIVGEYPLADVPSLRLRREEPGTYYANLLVGRLIAFGMYALGAISLTSLAFAALTDAFHGSRAALVSWASVVGIELVVLFGLSIAGRLPATRRPRPEEALTERILFLGALIMGFAVFLFHDVATWRGALMGIYGALGVFLAVFAGARLRWESRFPVMAVAGLAVCVIAFLVLW